ncbi:TetR family transcriptional regulator [Virgisporangium aliadipatigenens]|uniref:TetR family transcriptional regulator n=1 Tax=Virgisporangium aliadipatigenens TaxID=741659 RepID=A0A8J4DQL0_9ACTN|nr:TetR family transcriptional regulator [Virgisporangium aliadipatigenens]GIJ46106.1 TetR family transcriptional regulator [Virgisporangium aliadipatigenens]
MGRPRGFDEEAVTAAAAALFAARAYDGVGVDDLVQQLGVHRNSLYKTFGSKRGLYLVALRWYSRHVLVPLADRLATGADTERCIADLVGRNDLDLLLLAAVERAPADAEVASVVAETLQLLQRALDRASADRGRITLSEILGERLRARAVFAPSDDDSVD